MRTVHVPVGSVEQIDADFTASASLVGTTPTIALQVAGAATTWLPAAWVGTPTTEGTARTTAVQTLAVGTYVVRLKVDAGTEEPIRDCYVLKVHP